MEKDKKLLSIVVPCYNEEDVLMQFYDSCLNVLDGLLKSLDYEIIFIDDGSTDKTLKILRELSNIDKNIKYISFSRNFGKEAGIYAGLKAAKGDYVVLMDADLQHPPKYISDMYEILREGEYDSVGMIRNNRQGEKRLRATLSTQFYRIMASLGGTNIPEGATDFRMMTRTFVEGVLSLGECNRFTKGIFSWVGFNTKWLTYPDTERAGGKSKWTLNTLFHYSIDGMLSFSTKPLSFASICGTSMSVIAFISLIIVLISNTVQGYDIVSNGVLLASIFFVGGLILLAVGISGQYLARAYSEIKRRPVYIVKEENINGTN